MNQNFQKKTAVGILGATGTVGQRFVSLLEDHPWFDVKAVAASRNSAGRLYKEVVGERWAGSSPVPSAVGELLLFSVEDELDAIKEKVDFVFSAISAEKKLVQQIENSYAEAGMPVVSTNSAHRLTEDVPLVIPEINPQHLEMIPIQQKNRGWKNGLIVAKPNCSIQSYVPVIEALKDLGPDKVLVSTYQAISGAGKTFNQWPEMVDNVIPFIKGEEEKSEKEPMKIWGSIVGEKFRASDSPLISANCIRVPVTDGHMAAVNFSLAKKATEEDILSAFQNYQNPISEYALPSAPDPFIKYFSEEDRPQTKLDRSLGEGMAISIGKLRKDPILGWRFVALSHNTIRGASGGAILLAELLKAKGFIR